MHTSAASWPGRAGEANEDAFLCLEDLVVVADGATAPAGLETGCVHGPRWYSRQLVGRVAVAETIEPEAALTDILAAAISSTAEAHAGTCDVGHPGSPSATVAILRCRPGSLEWLVLGDATVVLEENGADVHVTSDRRIGNSSRVERFAVLTGDSTDGHHAERVAALVDAQRGFRNIDGGFWIAAADPAAAFRAYTGEQLLSPGTGWRAALMTDGASAAVDTYELTDWRGALDALAKNGPDDFLATVRAIETVDPDLITYPRMKVSDDATVVYASGQAIGH
jgi:protein phosphatase 2C-like protein